MAGPLFGHFPCDSEASNVVFSKSPENSNRAGGESQNIEREFINLMQTQSA